MFFKICIFCSIVCQAFADNTQDVFSISVCSKQTLSCPQDSVIYVESAHLGVYKSSTCIDSQPLLKEENCGVDVTLYMESRCSGLPSCNLTKNDGPLAEYSDALEPNPCPVHLNRWLEMKYSCKQYYNPGYVHCQNNRPIPVTASSGLLSSYFTWTTKKGSRKCPWSFEVRPSQTLVLSLWDLVLYNEKDDITEPSRCLIYATINSTGYLSPVCPGPQRRQVLYAKSDGTVVVAMVHGDSVKYLIEFEVLDCPPYSPPSFVSVIGSERSVHTVRCLEGDDQHRMTVRCENKAWTEVTKRNCSIIDDATIIFSEAESSTSSQSVLLIVAVIAVATVISIGIIFVGLYCLRACPFQKSRNQTFNMSVSHIPQSVAMDKYSSENLFLRSQSMRELYPMLANPDRMAAGQRDYATTLQMRQMAGYYPEPNAWCPTHGPYYMGRSFGGASTVDRKCNTSKMKRNISYNTPPTHGLENNSNKCTPVAGSPPHSPFYHELDHNLLRTPTEPGPVSLSDAHNPPPDPPSAYAATATASVVPSEDGGAKTPV